MGIHAHLFGSISMQYHVFATACLSSGAGTLRSVVCLSPAFLYVRSDTTMDPMCVRAANALARL